MTSRQITVALGNFTKLMIRIVATTTKVLYESLRKYLRIDLLTLIAKFSNFIMRQQNLDTLHTASLLGKRRAATFSTPRDKQT